MANSMPHCTRLELPIIQKNLLLLVKVRDSVTPKVGTEKGLKVSKQQIVLGSEIQQKYTKMPVEVVIANCVLVAEALDAVGSPEPHGWEQCLVEWLAENSGFRMVSPTFCCQC